MREKRLRVVWSRLENNPGLVQSAAKGWPQTLKHRWRLLGLPWRGSRLWEPQEEPAPWVGMVVICRDIPRCPQPALAVLQEEIGVSLRKSLPQSGMKQLSHSSRRAAGDVQEFRRSWWWEQTASPLLWYWGSHRNG